MNKNADAPRPNLHFVMFSTLLSHGGGRETWLNNVLPALQAMPEPPRLVVYYIADAANDGERKISAFDDANIHFVETRLPVSVGKWSSMVRIAKFCISVIAQLRDHTDRQSVIVGVGTFYEGAVIALASLFGVRRRESALWIRGIWSKEINHRHGHLVKKLICQAEHAFMSRADKIIANGHDTKAYYEQQLKRHVEAIPNALDLKRFSGMTRTALATPPVCISYIGRLSEEKGLRSYVAAIDQFVAARPELPVRFEIVGDGPLRALAEACASAHPRHVLYRGALRNEDMPQYLDSIDAGVCLTFSKESGGGGVSNGLLELIGTQRLVIAWDSVIFRQVLEEAQAAFVAEDDIVALAGTFASVAEDAATFTRKIQNSRSAISAYTLDAHVKHFMDYLGYA